MEPIPSIGLIELIVLACVAGLACSVPLIGAVIGAVIVISRKRSPNS